MSLNRLWLIVCLLLLHQLIQAQNFVTLKGKVFDQSTNIPLPYASVSIPHTGTGVVTNEFGEFFYNIPANSAIDTVQISFIGYKKLYKKLSSIKPDIIYSFGLVPEIKEIDEVKITGSKGITASDMVKKTIRHIYKNFPQKNFLIYGYYRDYIKDKTTDDYKNLTEAAVIINDRGFRSMDYEQSRIKLEQIRYNPGFQTDEKLNSGYNNETKYIPSTSYKESNELAILRLHDPFRNSDRSTFSFVYRFNYNFIPNHTFHYESIIDDGNYKIYEISFETYQEKYHRTIISYNKNAPDSMIIAREKHEYWVNGKIYIHSKNYAILKFTYTVTCKLPTYSGKFFDLNLEYKNYNDKYFLNYLSMCNYFEFKGDTSSISASKPEQYFQYRELFVNKIVTDNFEPVKREEAIRKNTTLISNKIPVDEGFWKNYNYTNYTKLIE